MDAAWHELPPDLLTPSSQQRAADEVQVERPPHPMHGDGRQRHEIGRRVMGHEVNLTTFGEIPGERVVRGIHAAERREITRDQQPRRRAH